jgi:hypothetical protein
MRYLMAATLFALVTGCANKSSLAPEVINPASVPASATAEVGQPQQVAQITTQSTAPLIRPPAVDKRDRSKIPATTNLGKAEVLGAHGHWKILRSKNPMSDKISCTAMYKDGGRIQLSLETLYIGFRGHGGVESYQIRIDERPAAQFKLADHMEKALSSIMLPVTQELLSASRVRVSGLTVLQGSIELDLDLKGIRQTHTMIAGPECAP